MRRSVYKVLLLGDKMFAPVLGETASEAFDNTVRDDPESSATPAAESMKATVGEALGNEAEAHAAENNSMNFNNDKSMVDPDELLQAQIREQDLKEEAEDDDPFASEDEFPDVMDIFKKEQA
jgi:hypothetical protein